MHFPNWMKDHCGLNYKGIATVMGVLIILTVAVTIGSVAFFASKSCYYKSHLYNRQTHYNLWAGGCFIRVAPHQFISIDQYNGFRSVP